MSEQSKNMTLKEANIKGFNSNLVIDILCLRTDLTNRASGYHSST